MKPAPSSRPGRLADFTGLLAAAIQLLGAKLKLAGLEMKEAGALYGVAAAMIAGGLFAAVLGYVFLVITAVFGIAAAFDSDHAWIAVMGGAALLHFGGAVALVLLARRRVQAGVFSSTLDEFRKDQEWLTKLANTR